MASKYSHFIRIQSLYSYKGCPYMKFEVCACLLGKAILVWPFPSVLQILSKYLGSTNIILGEHSHIGYSHKVIVLYCMHGRNSWPITAFESRKKMDKSLAGANSIASLLHIYLLDVMWFNLRYLVVQVNYVDRTYQPTNNSVSFSLVFASIYVSAKKQRRSYVMNRIIT